MAFQRVQSTSQLASASLSVQPQGTTQAQQIAKPPLTQTEIANQAFEQDKFEAAGLEIKQQSDKISPGEQCRLGVLQAKMGQFWAARMEQSSAMGQDFAQIPARSPHQMGLPNPLKSGIESIAGFSMDDVKIHYNSPKPSQIEALAYTQGADIYVAPGQERHLPHEAWHVVQQKQGRVQPTLRANGVEINSNPGLEAEAERLGSKALHTPPRRGKTLAVPPITPRIVQRVKGLVPGTLVKVMDREGVYKIASVSPDGGTYSIAFPEGEKPYKHLSVFKHEPGAKSAQKPTPLQKPTSFTPLQKPTSFQKSIVLPSEEKAEEKAAAKTQPQEKVSAPLAKPKAQSSDDFKIITDADVEGMTSGDISQRKPPSVLKKTINPSLTPLITSKKVDFKETARIDVKPMLQANGVALELDIYCNPKYMCAPHDLVPIYLESANDMFIDTIAVLEPTAESNYVQVKVFYTYKQLANRLGIKSLADKEVAKMKDEEIIGPLSLQYPELGVKAQWLANTTGTNAPNHTSGGVIEKGGSGKIPLRAITREDLAATEGVRNTEWNAGAKLRAGRPVYNEFQKIFQLDKEMATTLEAESEYVVEPEHLTDIVNQMQALLKNTDLQKSLGIRKMSGNPEPKVYEDTYYDLVNTGQEASEYQLLKNKIVLRRRHVATDPIGTFLFAVKGRTVEAESERIRLASQVNLNEKELQTSQGMEKLKALLKDKNTDNAFGRVLNDALEKGNQQLPETFDLKEALSIKSTRYKFLLELEHSTAIDFSADFAEGYLIGDGKSEVNDKPPMICSFEFGVGHPGLVATNTAAQGSSGSVKPSEIKAREKVKTQGLVTRPYHVPQDLDNPALFKKPDYQQYKALRDTVIDKIFKTDKTKLKAGGNKANLLAIALGIIKE